MYRSSLMARSFSCAARGARAARPSRIQYLSLCSFSIALAAALACQPGAQETETETDATSGASETTAGPTGETEDATETGGTTGGELPAGGVAIAPGREFACMIDGAGDIRCWGTNRFGQHGDGTTQSSTGTSVPHDEAWLTLDAGRAHVCAIDSAGALYCWGDQSAGAVGDGTMPDFPIDDTQRPSPIQVGHDGPWVAVSAADDNSCAIDSAGALWCWGENESGQLGNGGIGAQWATWAPGEVEGGGLWVDVATSSGHTCGVQQDGSLWCWGDNGEGQLGDGTTMFSSTPVQVGADTDWAAVAVTASLYEGHTCAIKQDGSLWCWGKNQFGALGVGDNDDRLTPTAVAGGGVWTSVDLVFRSTCGTRGDGSLWCWGGNTSNGLLANGMNDVMDMVNTPQQVQGGADWRDVNLEGANGCAVSGEDRPFCWGDNDTGALGVLTSGPYEGHYTPVEVGVDLRNPPGYGWTALAVGQSQSCARDVQGALWCWGGGAGGDLGSGFDDVSCNMADPGACTRTAPRKVVGGGAWGEFAAGWAGTCGVRDDGSLWCWGGGEIDDAAAYAPAQVGVDADWSDIVVTVGHFCGLKAGGELWCWGANSRGQLGNGQGGPDMIEASPVQVGAASDWQRVGDTYNQTCAIRQPGTLWCWGANDRGQLGLGTSGGEFGDDAADEWTPAQVGAADDWVEVCGGRYHTCGRRQGGTLWCWGSTVNGALGDGVDDDAGVVSAPQQVGADTDWQQLACGDSVTCGRKAGGAVLCWGSNYNGAVGVGDLEVDGYATPTAADIDGAEELVSGSGDRVCARLDDGSAWCWGGAPLGDHNVFPWPSPRQVVEGDELP